MNKLKTFIVLAVLAATSVSAQDVASFGYFDHLGAGISVGTDGIGIDLGAPLGNSFQMRAGVSFLPNIKVYDTDFNYTYGTPKKEATTHAELNVGWVNGKLLVDYFPFKKSTFRITAGLFAGTSDVVKVHNTTPIMSDGEGVYIGKVAMQPEDGNAKLHVRTNAVKPYVGIGVGRAVPSSRVEVGADLGVMIWGKPTVWAWGKNADTDLPIWTKYTKQDFDDKNIEDAFDVIQKFPVLPVISVRLGIRLF